MRLAEHSLLSSDDMLNQKKALRAVYLYIMSMSLSHDLSSFFCVPTVTQGLVVESLQVKHDGQTAGRTCSLHLI